MVNAGEDWAEGISCELESNQGGAAACPACPLGLETGTWEPGAVQLSQGASGTCGVGLQEYLLGSSEKGSLGCEKSVW